MLGLVSGLLCATLRLQAGSPGKSLHVHGSFHSGQPMTRLLAVQFAAGRPRLTPAEEKSIVQQISTASIQNVIRNPSVSLVAVGYMDGHGDAEEGKRAAFRRAQLVLDLLHDRCQFTGSCQAATMGIQELPRKERVNKEGTVEVWMIDP